MPREYKRKMLLRMFAVSLFFLLRGSLLQGALSEVILQSEGAILINAETGKVLYEKDAHKSFYPASTTKIATASYALKVRGNHLDKQITAEQESLATVSDAEMERSNYNLPSHWLVPGVMHIGIKKGEILSLKDLLYGTMIASGGDASNVIAQYIGGTIPSFMKLLNQYLKEIGCQNTVFMNPHGLFHPKHLTTPYDMALITQDALKNETFREIVKTVRYSRPQTNKQSPTTLVQTNHLIKKGKYYYPKAIGVKTGYLSKSQNTLVAAAKEGDRTLIAVLFKCKAKDKILQDAVALFEEAFKEKKVSKRLLAAGPQSEALLIPEANGPIKTYLKEDVLLEYFPSEKPQIKGALYWDSVALPIKKDQRIGEFRIEDENQKILQTAPLYASEEMNYGFPFRVKHFFSGFWLKFAGIIGGLILIAMCLIVYKKKSF